MYRVSKVLNNNGVIAINMEENHEYVLLGKGIGFGKRVSQRFEKPENCTVYSLTDETDRENAKDMVKELEPEYLEIGDQVLQEAQKIFGRIDRRILFPLADHISFAVSRIKNKEQISNPLTEDIKALFYQEFKAASVLRPLLKERMQIEIDEHEIGYVALHVHSAIEDEKVSEAMQMAAAVRECIGRIEERMGQKIDIASLAYNRLMNHIKYMVARAQKGEKLKLDMNEYMEVKFPEAFSLAASICDYLGSHMRIKLDGAEIGYLAMHIGRVYSEELEETEEAEKAEE